MDSLGLDPNINKQVCASNTDRKTLIISTDDYGDYNFITIHNYYRIFTIIGLITLLILAPISIYIHMISNNAVVISITIFLIILVVLSLMGFIGMMQSLSNYYNITEQIYIYDNPALGSQTCNITYGFTGGSDIYSKKISKLSVGFLQFTFFCLILGFIILTGMLLMNAFSGSRKKKIK